MDVKHWHSYYFKPKFGLKLGCFWCFFLNLLTRFTNWTYWSCDGSSGCTAGALRAGTTRTTGGAGTSGVSGELGTPGTSPLPREAAIDGRLAESDGRARKARLQGRFAGAEAGPAG